MTLASVSSMGQSGLMAGTPHSGAAGVEVTVTGVEVTEVGEASEPGDVIFYNRYVCVSADPW